MKPLIVLVLVAALSQMAQACLHFEAYPAARARPGDVAPAPTPEQPPSWKKRLETREDRGVWEERAKERQAAADGVWDFRSQNNLSVALAHLGRLDEALERMQTVERTFPGHPFTAYNLGTVYELKGDQKRALEWTHKGIERETTLTGRTPLDGTEWLHIRILEAQVAAKSGVKALSVCGLDFGSGRTPQTPSQWPRGNRGQMLKREEVQNSLFEQLHERLEFVPAPNPTVGSLLFDLGNLVALDGTDQDAKELFGMALEYGSPQRHVAQNRFDYYDGAPNYPLYAALLALGVGCLVGGKTWLRWREERAWMALPILPLAELEAVKLKKRSPKVVIKNEPWRGVAKDEEN